MNIVCASTVFSGEEAFSTLGRVVSIPEEQITADSVRDADVLITRTKTKINRSLLQGSRVRFVGSAVAGTDHIHIPEVESLGITWTSAPGCNANSVAEYVVTALLLLAEQHGRILSNMTLGVIGVGHIGSRVVEKARALGMTVLLNDPPKYDVTCDPAYRPLAEVLAVSDVVTFHVPLVDDGPHPTRQMIKAAALEQMKPGAWFINAARGEIMDSDALLLALDRGQVDHAALDVFENEPRVRAEVVSRVDIATPHIAGYSLEGRINGTAMVYEACCRHVGVQPRWNPETALQRDMPVAREVDTRGRLDQEVLLDLMLGVYDIRADDAHFRSGVSDDPASTGRHFTRMRQTYPVRREWAASRIALRHASATLNARVKALGFRLVENI
jgi:erythronate-4-phosphate dehydrogenase